MITIHDIETFCLEHDEAIKNLAGAKKKEFQSYRGAIDKHFNTRDNLEKAIEQIMCDPKKIDTVNNTIQSVNFTNTAIEELFDKIKGLLGQKDDTSKPGEPERLAAIFSREGVTPIRRKTVRAYTSPLMPAKRP